MTTNRYNIVHSSEATGYKDIIVGSYSAANWRDALELYYNQHHEGQKISFVWPVRGILINGKRFVARQQ